MTTQDIIKQTESFTIEQKQQLAYYFFFATISEDKKQDFMHLFHYNTNFKDIKQNKYDNLSNSGAEDFGEIDMKNLKNDIYSYL